MGTKNENEIKISNLDLHLTKDETHTVIKQNSPTPIQTRSKLMYDAANFLLIICDEMI